MSRIGRHTIHHTDIDLMADDRLRHLYVIGQTGTGKSTLLENLAIEDMEHGNGLAFIDPHGTSAERLLEYVPARRIKDVVYINMVDPDHVVGLNVIEHGSALKADDVVAAFRHAFADSWGPRVDHFFYNAVRTLMFLPNAELMGIPLLFLNERYRLECLKHVDEPTLKIFWEMEYPQYDKRFLADALSPLLNKVMRVLASPDVRAMLCQPKSTIDLREIMDKRRILIVNVSKAELGEKNAQLIGGLITTFIFQAALTRKDTPEKDRIPFYLYVDEVGSVATETFGLILSEARKFGLSLTIASQFLAQTSDTLQRAIFGNVGSLVSLRVGVEDADKIAKYLGRTPAELIDLRNHHAIAKLLRNGNPQGAEFVDLSPLPPLKKSRKDQAIAWSRSHAARPRTQVEWEITRHIQKYS